MGYLLLNRWPQYCPFPQKSFSRTNRLLFKCGNILACSCHSTPQSSGAPCWCSLLRAAAFSTQNPALAEKTSFGGLKDEDRIFTNLYCQGDPFIKVRPLALLVSG